jgi:hypothetical protein
MDYTVRNPNDMTGAERYAEIITILAGAIKALTDERLQEVREALIKEVREVGRALHWVEGVIKLKAIERDKA